MSKFENKESLEKMSPKSGYHLSYIAEQVKKLRKEKGDEIKNIKTIRNNWVTNLLTSTLRSQHKEILNLYGKSEKENKKIDRLLATAIALDKKKTLADSKRYKGRVYIEINNIRRAEEVYEGLQNIKDRRWNFPYKWKIAKVWSDNVTNLAGKDYNLIRRSDETLEKGTTEWIDDIKEKTKWKLIDDFTSTSTAWDIWYTYSTSSSQTNNPSVVNNINNSANNSSTNKNTLSPSIESNPNNSQKITNGMKIDDLKKLLWNEWKNKWKGKKWWGKSKKKWKGSWGSKKWNKNINIHINSWPWGGGAGWSWPTGPGWWPNGPDAPLPWPTLDDHKTTEKTDLNNRATVAKNKVRTDETAAKWTTTNATTISAIDAAARAAETAIDNEKNRADVSIEWAPNLATATNEKNTGITNINTLANTAKTTMDDLVAAEKTAILDAHKTTEKTDLKNRATVAKNKVRTDETAAKWTTTNATTISAIDAAARAVETTIDAEKNRADIAIDWAPNPATATNEKNTGITNINNLASTAKTTMDDLVAAEKTAILDTLKITEKADLNNRATAAKNKVRTDETVAKNAATNPATQAAIDTAARAAETAIDNEKNRVDVAIDWAPNPATATNKKNTGIANVNNLASTAKTTMDDLVAAEAVDALNALKDTAKSNLTLSANAAKTNLDTLTTTLKTRTTDTTVQDNIDAARDAGKTAIDGALRPANTAIDWALDEPRITLLENACTNRMHQERDNARATMNALILTDTRSSAIDAIDAEMTTANTKIAADTAAALIKAGADATATAGINTEATDARADVLAIVNTARADIGSETDPATIASLRDTANAAITARADAAHIAMDGLWEGVAETAALSAHKEAAKWRISTAETAQRARVTGPATRAAISTATQQARDEIDLPGVDTTAAVDAREWNAIANITRLADDQESIETLIAYKEATKIRIQTAANEQKAKTTDPVVRWRIDTEAINASNEIDLPTTTTQAQVDIVTSRAIAEMTRRADHQVNNEALQATNISRQAPLIAAARTNDDLVLWTHPKILDNVDDALKKPRDRLEKKRWKIAAKGVMIMPEILRWVYVKWLKRLTKPSEARRNTRTADTNGNTVDRNIEVTRRWKTTTTTINAGQGATNGEIEIVERVNTNQRSRLNRRTRWLLG